MKRGPMNNERSHRVSAPSLFRGCFYFIQCWKYKKLFEKALINKSKFSVTSFLSCIFICSCTSENLHDFYVIKHLLQNVFMWQRRIVKRDLFGL